MPFTVGLINRYLFESNGPLMEGGLVSAVLNYSGKAHFVVEDEITAILQSDNVTEGSLLEHFIGLRRNPKFRWDANFKYIPWNQELTHTVLGGLHRIGTLGKSYLVEGEPGCGKSTGVPAIAATIEHIMHGLGAKDFEMPVYVIGVGSDKPTVPKKSKARDGESGEANNARDADIRKLMRARFLLAKFGKPALLLVEEADGLVATLVADQGGAITRAQRNDILEHSPVPTFYLTNHPERFDAAARRRFITYRMNKPPQEVRVSMIVDMGAALGLAIRKQDAITMASRYEFTPGVIESALLLLRDYKAGQALAQGKLAPVGDYEVRIELSELKMGFERKQVGLVGTNLQLIDKLKIPNEIDPELYFPTGISQTEFAKLASGSVKPKLWLLAGLSSTEVTELALVAAGKTSKETEIIDLASLDNDFRARLETAVTYKRPIVIVGADSLQNIHDSQQLENMPTMKALKNHVRTANMPVYIVVHASPQDIPLAIEHFFSGEDSAYAGFNLAIADQLLGIINKLSGNNFEYELTDFLGLACAGPADVRKVLAKLNGGSHSLPKIAEALDQIVPHALTRDQIQHYTGIEVSDNPLVYH